MQITQVEKDRELSFAIINYLSASYRGKLAGLTLLGQLQHSSFDVRDLEALHKITERIAEWFDNLMLGESLFCTTWVSLETFESQNAISLLQKLKPELLAMAEQITALLSGKEKIDSENAKWLFHTLVRSAFARDVYLRGFVLFGEKFNKPQIVSDYGTMLNGAVQHVNLVQQGVDMFQSAAFNLEQLGDDFVITLLTGCEELPSIFRTHAHDISLLASNYNGGKSFENLGFAQEEASAWKSAGIEPEVAGYWRANGFSPEQSAAWVASFIFDPTEAGAWLSATISPETAKPWKELGFPFHVALPWIQAGYTAQIAKDQIQSGIKEPPARP